MALLAWAPVAEAAFPGQNGKIAYSNGPLSAPSIWTMNPDGSGQTRLGDGYAPAWSADGQALAFTNADGIAWMPAHGGGETLVQPHGGCSNPLSYCVFWEYPAWSPDGTRIAVERWNGEIASDPFLELWVISADGEGWGPNLDVGTVPTWRPDGLSIAYIANACCSTEGPLKTISPSGGPSTQLTDGDDFESEFPDYSPDGTKIAFSGGPWDRRDNEIYVFEGSGPSGHWVQVTDNAWNDEDPAWSPDGTKIAFTSNRDGNYEIYVMNADGTNQTRLTNDPQDQTLPSWQPTWGSGYPRPKGATPMRVSLVPAYAACAAPNRTHGPPLAFGSCNPPAPESAELTVGDAPANMSGFVRYEAILGNVSTPEDEADLGLRVQISDVRERDTLDDYAGEVQGQASTRMTDRTGSGGDPGTAIDVRFPLTTPCAPTPDPAVGSTCSLTTTLDTLIPGAVVERERTILQLGQVRVVDGGPDGDVLTEPNTVFLRQGVFVP